MKNKIIAFILVLQIFSVVFPPVYAAENIINIGSRKDFTKFSRNCTLDTWSRDKIINLTCDIDFSGTTFTPIATFDGIFNGNGHTVSGIKFTSKGSYQGMFRYVGANGKICDLNINGKFMPGGSKSFVGGIAGENSGSIENCSFNGSVKGENIIGGIAGNNNDSGQIIHCTVYGNITGENSSGGIAGKNSGYISSCANHAAVNTIYEEKKNGILDIDPDTGAIIENYKNKEEQTEEESVLGHSDTGGIAGYSSGIIQGCINSAAIGYKHIGYNVGGIAGRQSGYILGCQNHGFIQGRKDVGGIVGQAEPYILLNTSESLLKDLRKELNNLNSMVNKFITDTENLSDSAQGHLTDISKYSENALDSAENLINQGTDFADDNLNEINAQAAILSNTIDKLVPIFESLEKSGKNLTNALDDIASAFEDIETTFPDIDTELDDISDAFAYISLAEQSIRKSISQANRAIDDLHYAIVFTNIPQVEKAESDLSAAIDDIIAARRTIKKSLADIEEILSSSPDKFEDIGLNTEKIITDLKIIIKNLGIEISSLKVVKQSLDIISLNSDIDFSMFRSAAKEMKSAVTNFSNAMYYITHGLSDMGTAFRNISDKFQNYTTDFTNTWDALSDGITDLSYASEDISDAIGNMKNIITDLSNEKTLEFVKLGDDFKNTSENLFSSLSDISDEITRLKDTISSEKENISADLSAINNQFKLVMNLMIDEFEELKDGTRSLSDIFLDVSDEDIESTLQGKLADCRNFGSVEADRNTGGIAGAMAIEYSKNPEDDIDKPNTLNFTYRTYTVLQACINDGKITGKKDCTGGITGLAEIGTIYKCENYGDTVGTNGNYVGGIAGKSCSAIRKSYAKNKADGKRYIGGIAGKAYIITGSYSIVNIIGEENTGAVCGDADTDGELYSNYFTDNGLGAIDGISRKGKAEPIDFEELKLINGIPSRFISFTVTFTADGNIIETQNIKYGENTSRIKYPEIPKKDEYFGVWNKIDDKTVTENINVVCEYKPYITVLSSVEKSKNGKLSDALCEGKFTDEAVLHITPCNEAPPAKADNNTEVYDISLSGTDIKKHDDVPIHLLNENRSKATVWLLNDGKWSKTSAVYKGKYIIIKTKGAQNTVCIKYHKRNPLLMMIIIIISIFGIPSAFIFFKRKRKKSKH